MVKVLYVPLDDRGCNYDFPWYMSQMTPDMELLRPPYEHMGFLKQPADMDKIWQWLFENAPQCQYAILSVDTLVYGNLVNSRIHQYTAEQCLQRLENFQKLKKLAPQLEIHAFNLVARVAGYDNAHEDPDYWDQYGYAIWRLTCLADKQSRLLATEEEQEEIRQLESRIPAAHLEDFFCRREVDRATNLACVELVRENVFDTLTIPKDDTAEFGFAAMDSQALSKKVREYRLFDRILLYPGADEVGSVLFARIFCRHKQYQPRIYVRYSSTLGPTLIPRYEDRPLHESVKSQIVSAGGLWEDNSSLCDCMLAINASGTRQLESTDQYQKDASFVSHLNLAEFLRYIQYFKKTQGKAVGLAEVSTCNGCENECMEYAQSLGIYDMIQAVGGWNTAQNTIGVVLAQTIIAAYYQCHQDLPAQRKVSEEFKARSLVADWLCQSNVLHWFLQDNLEKGSPVNPYQLGEDREQVTALFQEKLRQKMAENFPEGLQNSPLELSHFSFDWDGAFFFRVKVGLPGL